MKGRVLVADDEHAIGGALEAALRDEGYDVRVAGDGRAALALLATDPAWRPDVVLLDLLMAPGGPGHVVPLGLLVAGIAVPGLLLGLLARPLAVAGLVIAGVAELSWVGLVWQEALPLLPLARFPALLWLLRAAFALPTARRREAAAPEPGEAARAAGTPAASLSLVETGRQRV